MIVELSEYELEEVAGGSVVIGLIVLGIAMALGGTGFALFSGW